MNAILIDDEYPARIRLRRLLKEYETTITIVDEAADGNEALQKIDALRPDVIFLDIQMPGMDGFEVLQKVSHMPIVIFTTAYDQYALKAFETNSVDYLLKPIEPERLQQAIDKLGRFSNATSREQIQKIIEFANQINPRKEISSFPIKSGDTIHLVRTGEIAYFEAKDKYITIHTLEGKEFLTDVSLKTMEDKLPANFLRVHRALIVNKSILAEIRKYYQNRFVLLLNDKMRTKVISGSGYADSIRNALERL
jgi:two-component system, LytTR family, response regulator